MTLVAGGGSGAAVPEVQDRAPALRASDLDRSDTVRELQDAVARGLLTPDEGSERMAAAFSARYLLELRPLTADLPRGMPQRAVAPGWSALAAMAVAQVRVALQDVASGRTGRGPVAAAFAVVLVLLFLAGAAAGELLFAWEVD